MSLSRHPKAHLSGWEGPFYPAGVGDLARVWQEEHPVRNTPALVAIAQQLRSYRGHFRATSTDGYDWFALLQFAAHTGAVLVAMPWAQDFDKHDGITTDRSSAVYTRGLRVSQRATLKIVDDLFRALSGANKTKG